MYRVIFEIVPLLLGLALWGGFEAFAHDGARLRFMRPRDRTGGDPRA